MTCFSSYLRAVRPAVALVRARVVVFGACSQYLHYRSTYTRTRARGWSYHDAS